MYRVVYNPLAYHHEVFVKMECINMIQKYSYKQH